MLPSRCRPPTDHRRPSCRRLSPRTQGRRLLPPDRCGLGGPLCGPLSGYVRDPPASSFLSHSFNPCRQKKRVGRPAGPRPPPPPAPFTSPHRSPILSPQPVAPHPPSERAHS